jgi:cytochrome c biogenesis protein
MPYKIIFWPCIKKLGNLSFSIFLLLLISAISILGTIVEQNQSIEYYQANYPLNTTKLLKIDWKIIQFFKLNELYSNWGFLCLVTLFALSLIVCTLSTQLPSLKNARRWKLKKQITSHDISSKDKIPNIVCPASIIYFLNQTDYYTFHQSFYTYSYKGLLGRLAPILVHISLINILIGSLISLLTSVSFQEMIPEGELFHLKNIIKSGQFSSIPDNFTGKINDFKIEYHSNGSIKQFYSNIAIINKQFKIVTNKTISVNKPLYFQGFTLYQTDWKVNGLKLKIGTNQIIYLPLHKISNNNQSYWLSSFDETINKKIILLVSDLYSPVLCYDVDGKLLQSIKLKEKTTINDIPLEIIELIKSTGIQIKKDLGIPIIYSNFFLLMLSSVVSYSSYSQLWLISYANEIKIFGTTNRAKLKFEHDILALKKMIINLY